MQNMTELSELEIIKKIISPTNRYEYNKACEIILKKYENLINKQWTILCNQIDSNWANKYREDFYSLSYEAIIKAASKVDLNKTKSNFMLIQLASWYISNVRKELIKKIVKTEPYIESIYMVNTDIKSNSDDVSLVKPYVEQAFYNSIGYQEQPEYKYFKKLDEENCKRSINECLKKWDSIEHQIFNFLCDGKSKVEISKLLDIPKAKIYYLSSKMQKSLNEELVKNKKEFLIM